MQHNDGGDGNVGGSMIETGGCEGDAIQACKVQINEDNCFVGEQQCIDGEWGPCVEPDSLQTNAIGSQGNCMNNPCNPNCQQYDEDPSPDLEAAGSPPPSTAAATLADVQHPFSHACLTDSQHHGCTCSVPGTCQLDTQCVSDECTPMTDGVFNTTGGPDFTIRPVCDKALIPVCNRGDVAGGNGVMIHYFSPDIDLCGGHANCNPSLRDMLPSAPVGSCMVTQDINPGECIAVDCDDGNNGVTMYHINGPDEAGGAYLASESDDLNNWSMYHPSSACQCASVSQTGSLQQVNMLLILDNSGSMSGTQWTNASDATAAFVTDPSADSLRLEFHTFDSANGGCDYDFFGGSCPSNPAAAAIACEDAVFDVDFLTGTHDTDISNWLTSGANDPPGGFGTVTGTPHKAKLEGAATVVNQWNTSTFVGERNVIVYISDGALTGFTCGTSAADIASVVSGTETFTVALPQADINVLDAIASTGGTGSAIDLTGVATGAPLNAAVAQALTDIQSAVSSCAVNVANPGGVDWNNVTVDYTPVAISTPTMIEVADAGSCDPTPSGNDMEYYLYPDAVNPTGVELCAPACADITADGGTLSFSGGCTAGYTASTQVITYDGDCSAYGSAASAFWDFLTYQSTIPATANIQFAWSTSNVSEADAAMGPFTNISPAADNSTQVRLLSVDPIDLRDELEALAQQRYLALEITINPTADGSATPVLEDWDVFFSCLANE